MHAHRTITAAALTTLVVMIAACASPSPAFFGAQKTEVTRDGMRFAVFQKGETAQAIRLGYANRAARRDMAMRLAVVMEEVTGCKIRQSTLAGDTTELRAKLTCPN